MVVTNFYVHALYKGSILINVSVMNCIDRYVNVKQKCETIIPQITSLYTLRNCSGRLMVQYNVLGKAILRALHTEGQFCHDYCLRCKNHLFNYALAAEAGLYVNR